MSIPKTLLFGNRDDPKPQVDIDRPLVTKGIKTRGESGQIPQ
jgi:hypothetical protein